MSTMAEQSTISITPERAEQLKSQPWYYPKIETVDPTMRMLLEERGIPSSEVVNHVQTLRDRAWNTKPYPCIGMFSFTRLRLSRNPSTKAVLAHLLSAPQATTLLDLGCGLAQDLRWLISSGVRPQQLYALDNTDGLFNLGFDLFCDKETFTCRFILGDMLKLDSVPADLYGTFNYIWAGSSFHLFNWDNQVKAGIVAAKLLKPETGVTIFGFQVAHVDAKHSARGMFLHNVESWQKMWDEVGDATASKWKTQAWLTATEVEGVKNGDPGVKLMTFWVKRVDMVDEEDKL